MIHRIRPAGLGPMAVAAGEVFAGSAGMSTWRWYRGRAGEAHRIGRGSGRGRRQQASCSPPGARVPWESGRNDWAADDRESRVRLVARPDRRRKVHRRLERRAPDATDEGTRCSRTPPGRACGGSLRHADGRTGSVLQGTPEQWLPRTPAAMMGERPVATGVHVGDSPCRRRRFALRWGCTRSATGARGAQTVHEAGRVRGNALRLTGAGRQGILAACTRLLRLRVSPALRAFSSGWRSPCYCSVRAAGRSRPTPSRREAFPYSVYP